MINIAIVGASGLVGNKILDILDEEKIKYNKLYLYASSDKTIVNSLKQYKCIKLTKENIKKDIDVVIFSAGNKVSLEFANEFIKNKTYVIDNSSAFREEKNIPLVIPSINFTKESFLIANPNCSTIQSVIVINEIKKICNIKRIDYSTYQAVSGSGKLGLNDLIENKKNVFKQGIVDNVIPQIDVMLNNKYTKEEYKMIFETNKILKTNIEISAFCARVPTRLSHGINITVKTDRNINLEEINKILKTNKLIHLIDTPINNLSNNTNKILVGRIRKDLYDNSIIHLYVCADNIRIGAAYNAVSILKKLMGE